MTTICFICSFWSLSVDIAARRYSYPLQR